VAAAVAVARYHEGVKIIPHFTTNMRINEVIRAISPASLPPEAEVWITDISWTEKETDAHLRQLAARGAKIYWFDHHRTAVERYRSGEIDVPFTDLVVKEECAASRLVYEYLWARLKAEGRHNPLFAALHRLVRMADDNDRWIHEVTGSRELALIVRAMAANQESLDAYQALLDTDEQVSYTPRMQEAYERATKEIQASLDLAEKSQVTLPIAGTDFTVVAALCDGYPSDVADLWGKTAKQTVFALYDTKSLAVSLRRSPDCTADLSRIARVFAGGGHPTASGCYIPELHHKLAKELGRLMAQALNSLYQPDIEEHKSS
jgi:oligoribonuclease NrnB/cAMP/cGMP phosphodiesterase (DHH superfamily)